MQVKTQSHQLWLWSTLCVIIIHLVQPQEHISALNIINPHLIALLPVLGFIFFSRYSWLQWQYPQMRLTYGFTALLLVLAFFAQDRQEAFLYTRNIVVCIPIMVSLLILINSSARLKSVINTFIFITIILCALGLWRYDGIYFNLGNYFGDPNDFSLFLNMMLPFVYYLFVLEKSYLKKGIYLGCIFVIVGVIALSFSRGGFLGLIGTAGVIWYYSKRKMLLFNMSVVLLVIIAIVIGSTWTQEIATITQGADDPTAHHRIASWLAAWNIFLDHPLGIGAQNTPYYMQYYLDDVYARYYVSHSIWFTVLAETGIIGTILFLQLLIINYRDLFATEQPERTINESSFIHCMTIACIASLSAFIISGTFLTVVYYPHIWYLSAIIILIRKIHFLEKGGNKHNVQNTVYTAITTPVL